VDSPGTYSSVLGSSYCTKIETGVDYWGNDIYYLQRWGSSVEDCCISCRLYRGCKYFAFNPYTGQCWLKFSDSNRGDNAERISGSVIVPNSG